jgi:transposase
VDAAVVQEVQTDLAGWRLNRVVWVVDRGMAGREQRIAFQRGGGQLIVGEKLRSMEGAPQEALRRGGRYRVVQEGLEIKELKVKNGSEVRRFVLVRNPKEAVRDRAQRDRILARLSAELEELKGGLPNRGKKHTKAACEIKSHPVYGRYVQELPTGELVIDRAKVRKEEKLDGKYLLSTTDPSLSADEVALGYKQLFEVERAFRTLKHTLELRPLDHRLPDRIRSHVLLCWLALLLVRVIELETGETWDRMREELELVRWVTLSAKEGAVQMTTEITAAQQKIFRALSIAPPKRVRRLELPSASL